MRVAVLVKQVPRFEEMALGPGGRLLREGVDLELNPYCRRAVSMGVALVRAAGGSCTVVTLGPPAAADCLREAVAWGADGGVLVTDPAFAGGDTLATSRALAAAISRLGRFDLVLTGRNSVDADTGQVPPAVAELLDLPHAGPARELTVEGDRVTLRCELDDGTERVRLRLPAVVSCAERLIEPAKVDPAGRSAVDPARLRRVGPDELPPGPWGEAGSPTRVGRVRILEAPRQRMVLSGTVAEQARAAVAVLLARGALDRAAPRARPVLASTRPARGPAVLAVTEPGLDAVGAELTGAASDLAGSIGGHAVALLAGGGEVAGAAGWGADRILRVAGGEPEDVAAALAGWCAEAAPWAVLVPSTVWGREVGARAAARLGAGLVGDAVELAVEDGRLVAWKPAFGGQLAAAITCRSAVQMATVRPGALPRPQPREAPRETPVEELAVTPRGRLERWDRVREDDVEALTVADAVIGVGTGVEPGEYAELEPLVRLLGAELGATRRVTDRGWMPRSRQVGLTGRHIAPRLYVSLASSGKFNHLIGVRGAGTLLAVNRDPAAPVLSACDVGMVAGWRDAVAALVEELAAAPVPGG